MCSVRGVGGRGRLISRLKRLGGTAAMVSRELQKVREMANVIRQVDAPNQKPLTSAATNAKHHRLWSRWLRRRS